MKKCITTVSAFIFLLTTFSPLFAASKKVIIDSLKIGSEVLLIDFHAEGIVDDKIIEGLRKGLTSTIDFQVQLWCKRPYWFNQLVSERSYRVKVYYDNWENKFLILSPHEKRMTSSAKVVRQKCSQIEDMETALLSDLKSGTRYFVVVKIILKPLSVENYREIKNWLRGEVEDIDIKKLGDAEEREKDIKSRILRMFMVFTGFGDRVFSGKSRNFEIGQGNQIIWEE